MASEADRRAAAAAKKQARQRRQALTNITGDLEAQGRAVRAAESQLQLARDRQTQLMLAGRQFGLTWDDLASASGITRQAVQQRVVPLVDSPD